MARLAIYLLGRIEAHLDLRPIPGVEASKWGMLLAYLAVEGCSLQGRQVLKRQSLARQHLAALLWPERPEQEALGSLRFALAKLRAALEDRHPGQAERDRRAKASFLLVDRYRVGLNPQADIWVDVTAFEQQAAACEQLAAPGQPQDALPQALQAALDLYQGPFLQGLPVDDSPAFESWALARGEQLERQHQRLLYLLAAGCEQAGHWREAEAAYRTILASRPWDEATQRRLMRLLDHSGQRGAALAQYEACRHALQAELEVEPDSETSLLYQAIKRRAPVVLPAASPPPATPTLDTARGPAVDARLAGTPFVARQHELEALEMALERTLAGQGQVALVTGEAGSGKTALLSEFARRALARRPDLLVIGGRCNACSGLGQPYLPFIEAMQMLAGEWDPLPWASSLDQEHQARLQAALPWVARILIETAPALLERFVGRAALVQRVAQAMGSRPAWMAAHQGTGKADLRQMDSPLEVAVLFEQVTRVEAELARRCPLVILLDDLQWVDPGSTALLFHLARRGTASHTLLVAAYRSGEGANPAEAGQQTLREVLAELRSQPGSVQIDLDRSDERAFVAAYLEKDPLLQPQCLEEDFRLALARHTGGNPLFIAELLRYLQANGDLQRGADGAWVSRPGLNWKRLPERIEAAIARRMARLPEQWADWLYTASVMGDSFTAEVLARVHGLEEPVLLRDLSGPLNVARGAYRLLQFDGVQWLGSQRLSRYRFRHVLFQTYLYEQMDPAERSRRHAAVGQALERLYSQAGEQSGRYASELAHHFEAAGMAEQAAAYWLQAGRYALYLAAASMAQASFRRGLALLAPTAEQAGRRPATPECSRLEMRLNLGLAAALISTSDWGGAGRAEALQRALELAQQCGREDDPPELFPLLHAQANWLMSRNELEQTGQLADQMLALAKDSPGLPQALACWIAGAFQALRAAYPASRQYLEGALAAHQAAGQPPTLPLVGVDLEATCRAWLSAVLAMLGCIDQAGEMAGQAYRRVDALGGGQAAGGAIVLLGEAAVLRGDQAALRSLSAGLLQMGWQLGSPAHRAYGLFLQSEAELLGADQQQALAAVEAIRQGLQVIASSSIRVAQIIWDTSLARACLKAGLIDAGLEAVTEALERRQAAGQLGPGCAELYRLRGELLAAGGPSLAVAQPEPGPAEIWFQRALAASRQAGALTWELRAALGLARLWRFERPAEARALLGEVYGRFTEGWGCPDLRAARALLDTLDQRATGPIP